MSSPFRSQVEQYGMAKPDAYNPYVAGAKQYGQSGLHAPTVGPVDKSGYMERDAVANAQRNALLQRMKAQQSGDYMSSANLSGGNYGV